MSFIFIQHNLELEILLWLGKYSVSKNGSKFIDFAYFYLVLVNIIIYPSVLNFKKSYLGFIVFVVWAFHKCDDSILPQQTETNKNW